MRYNKDEYRLWQRKGGIFYVCTGSGASTRRVSTGTEVRAEAEQFRAQFIAGAKNAPPGPTPIIRDLLDRYETQKGPRIRSADTIKYHRKHLDDYFGNLQSIHISLLSLQEYAAHRKKQGKRRGSARIKEPVSDGTILREIGTLKAALRYAASMRWTPPVPELEAPVPKPGPRETWLTKEEAKRLLEKAKTPHIKLFIHLALATAARSGAILELKWDNVDFDHKLIDFGRGHGRKRRSIVPMNTDLFNALAEAHKTRRCEWVIETAKKPLKSIKGAFRRLTIDCGIDATAHALRHTAATWMVMSGVPLAEIARLLGDTEKTVEKVYGKHSPDYLRGAVESLSFCGQVQVDSKLNLVKSKKR